MKQAYVYILSNKNRTTLYIGVTSNLEQRILQHKASRGAMFTSKYNLSDLLYFEQINGIGNAIRREKQLKNWHRQWKIDLIKEDNSKMKDLAEDWFTLEEIMEYQEGFDLENRMDRERDPESSSG